MKICYWVWGAQGAGKSTLAMTIYSGFPTISAALVQCSTEGTPSARAEIYDHISQLTKAGFAGQIVVDCSHAPDEEDRKLLHDAGYNIGVIGLVKFAKPTYVQMVGRGTRSITEADGDSQQS